jgi:polyglycine hydrolase-like protein
MDWIAWHNRVLTDHVSLANQYKAQGYGFISLSIYGSIASPYYAAVMIRPAPSQQHHYPSVLGNTEMQHTFDLEAAQGYGPAMIAATGPAAEPLFAAVFEPQNPIALTRWGLPSVDTQGSQVSFKEYGPFPGWVPMNYSDNHILWRDASNNISLWVVDNQGNQVGFKEHGPFPG